MSHHAGDRMSASLAHTTPACQYTWSWQYHPVKDILFTMWTRFRLVIQKMMDKVAMFRFRRCHGKGYKAHMRARMEGTKSSGCEKAIVRRYRMQGWG
jgi:hypothetical protein